MFLFVPSLFFFVCCSLSICASLHKYLFLSIYLLLCIYLLSTYLSISLSIYRSISIILLIYISVFLYLYISLSFHLLPIYLSIFSLTLAFSLFLPAFPCSPTEKKYGSIVIDRKSNLNASIEKKENTSFLWARLIHNIPVVIKA